jgi:hypothetical protein
MKVSPRMPEWRLFARVAITLAVVFTSTGVLGAGLDSVGNTDGILTWQIGTLAAGKSSRQVVLFAFGDSYEKVAERLQTARRPFAALPDPPANRVD